MQMLELVKSFFGNIGNISKHKSDNTLRYTVGFQIVEQSKHIFQITPY